MHALREDQGSVAAVPFDPARPDAVVKKSDSGPAATGRKTKE